MPDNPPLTAAGAHDEKRPRPIPKRVREMIRLMVYGADDDPAAAPLDFIQAAKLAGIPPDVARRWVHRPAVIALLRSERKAFRSSINAGNELALRKIRDAADGNQMTQIGAIKVLEALDADQANLTRTAVQLPGLTIAIYNETPKASPTDRQPIDVTPPARPMIEHDHEPPPTERGEFISIEEVRGEQQPPRDDPPPLVEEPPPLREPKTLDEWIDRLTPPRLAPPNMAPAPPIRGEPNFREPEPRLSPMRRRWRDIRRGD